MTGHLEHTLISQPLATTSMKSFIGETKEPHHHAKRLDPTNDTLTTNSPLNTHHSYPNSSTKTKTQTTQQLIRLFTSSSNVCVEEEEVKSSSIAISTEHTHIESEHTKMYEILCLIGHLKLDPCDVCGCPYPHLYQLNCHDLYLGVGVNGLGDLSRSSKLLPAWLPYNGYPTEATEATHNMEYIYDAISYLANQSKHRRTSHSRRPNWTSLSPSLSSSHQKDVVGKFIIHSSTPLISSDHDIAMEQRKRRIQEKKDKKNDDGEALKIMATIGGLLEWSNELEWLDDTRRLASMTFLATANGCTPYSGNNGIGNENGVNYDENSCIGLNIKFEHGNIFYPEEEKGLEEYHLAIVIPSDMSNKPVIYRAETTSEIWTNLQNSFGYPQSNEEDNELYKQHKIEQWQKRNPYRTTNFTLEEIYAEESLTYNNGYDRPQDYLHNPFSLYTWMSHVELYTQSEKEERKIRAQESAELEKDFEDYIKAMQKNSKKKRRNKSNKSKQLLFSSKSKLKTYRHSAQPPLETKEDIDTLNQYYKIWNKDTYQHGPFGPGTCLDTYLNTRERFLKARERKKKREAKEKKSKKLSAAIDNDTLVKEQMKLNSDKKEAIDLKKVTRLIASNGNSEEVVHHSYNLTKCLDKKDDKKQKQEDDKKQKQEDEKEKKITDATRNTQMKTPNSKTLKQTLIGTSPKTLVKTTKKDLNKNHFQKKQLDKQHKPKKKRKNDRKIKGSKKAFHPIDTIASIKTHPVL